MLQCNFETVDVGILQCTECKRIIKTALPAINVHCNCNKQVSPQVRESRLAECNQCEHFAKLRCTLIDLGCKRTFLFFVNSSLKSCPLEKWSNVS